MFMLFFASLFWRVSHCEAEENQVSVLLEGGVAPFAKIEWVWSERDGFGSLGVTWTHAAQLGTAAAVALRGQGALSATAAELRGCLSLSHRAAVEDEARLLLTTELSDEAEEIQTAISADGAAADCVRAMLMREAEQGFLDRAYDHPFWNSGEFGTLRTSSDLPSELWVDGRDTGRVTPVSGLKLEAGPRTLTWRAIAVNWSRTETVLIEAGRNVTLNVRLEAGR